MYTYYSTIMSQNKIYYLIRKIFQNSNLNREKFIKNKINYNNLKIKNRNINNSMIIKRHMSTFNYKPPQYNSTFGGGGGPNGFGSLLACVVGFYFITDRFQNKKK